MSDHSQRWPMTEEWDRVTCALCGHHLFKDDAYRVELDEPGNRVWVCEPCFAQGGGEV